MCSTDTLQLNKTEMFAKIRAGLPEERQQSLNLLECKDDLLYAWDSVESCLLVLNWRAAQLKGHDQIKYQTLLPLVPLNFQVERVLASHEGSLIALAGARGLAVLELPRRWGRNGQFMEGKESITCRSSILDAHFFNNNPHLELRQIRWHPSSPTDSHLLALLSDNTIRVYDNSSLRHVWQIGPLPLKLDGNPNSSLPSAFDLGETAVDFDIAPAVKVADVSPTKDDEAGGVSNTTTTSMTSRLNQTKSMNQTKNLNQSKNLNQTKDSESQKPSSKGEKVEWPIVVLRENGNIYVLMAGIDTDRPRLQGPLTMTPAALDNYGLESCSLLVIPSLPPTLVVAESNGRLHHALLLEAESAEDSFSEIDATLNVHPSEWTVHVLETVELELGLPRDEASRSHSCPIHLKRDFINELRYFAYHSAGLHVVTVNFIGELQRFLESEVATDIASLSVASSAEYIVCTKIDSGSSSSGSGNVNAVLGFVLLQMPSGVVLLLASGQVISLKLVIDPKLLLAQDPTSDKSTKGTTESEPKSQELEQLLGPSFGDQIKGLLKRTVTQPILSLDQGANPSPQDCYELLTQAMEVLRTQYIRKHELVRAEFTKRLNTIRLRKEQQRKDIEYLERERDQIRENAHRLAERFEEISDQQELLTKKCQDLMRQANTCLPSNSLAEQEFSQEVEKLNKATKNMANALQKSREAINKQSYHIAKYNESAQHKKIELPRKQEDTIKEIIMQMTSEIDGQIRDVKRINKIVNI